MGRIYVQHEWNDGLAGRIMRGLTRAHSIGVVMGTELCGRSFYNHAVTHNGKLRKTLAGVC